jgi:hypothetical protein
MRISINDSKDLNHIDINNNNINNNLLNKCVKNNYRHKTEIFKIIDKREEKANKKFLTKKRGRNPKSSSQISNISHNRKSEDNMMRKIKNRMLDSALNLINDSIEKDNKKNNDKSNKKLYKIKSIYSEELNLKFNLYLILQKLKDIFCYELSGLYSNFENKDNKALINEIYNDDNKYPNSKRILEMTFYEYYHKIFLNEDKNILNQLGLSENKYNFDYYKNQIINEFNKKEEEKKSDKNGKIVNINKEIGGCNKNSYIKENECYLESLENLANNYEHYFYNRKGRKTKKSKKKYNKIIEKIIRNKNIYLSKLKNEVKKIIDKNKEYYKSNF